MVRKWSPLLKPEGVTIALLHPGKTSFGLLCSDISSQVVDQSTNQIVEGWVSVTEIGDGISEWMAKYNPTMENLTVEASAANSMKVLNGLTIEGSGEFFNHDGTKYPL